MSDNLLSVFGISESDLIERDKDGRPVLNDKDEPKPLVGTPRQNEIQRRLGPVLFKVYLMRSFALRIERDCGEVLDMVKQDTGPVADDIRTGVGANEKNAKQILLDTAELAKRVPAGFKPAGKVTRGQGKASRAIVEGATVDIKPEELTKTYADIITEEESKGMTVVKDTGTRVWCKTKSGDKVHIPKAHLTVSDA